MPRGLSNTCSPKTRASCSLRRQHRQEHHLNQAAPHVKVIPLGQFPCPSAPRVLPNWRADIREPLRRLKRISEGGVFANPDNFWLSDSFTALQSARRQTRRRIVKPSYATAGRACVLFLTRLQFRCWRPLGGPHRHLLTRCSAHQEGTRLRHVITHHNVKFRIDDSASRSARTTPCTARFGCSITSQRST